MSAAASDDPNRTPCPVPGGSQPDTVSGSPADSRGRIRELLGTLTGGLAGVDEPPGTPGERVAALRRSLRLTQAELAARLGVTERTIRRWESGQSPVSPMTLELLEVLEAGSSTPAGEHEPRDVKMYRC